MNFSELLNKVNVRRRIWSALKTLLITLAALFCVNWYQTKGLPSSLSDFEMKDNSDQVVQMAALWSEKPVTLVYVFAPWCGVCKLSLPVLESIRTSNGEVSIVALALAYDTPAEVDEMVAASGFKGRYFYGEAKGSAPLQIDAFPTMMIVSKDGAVRSATVGYTTKVGILLRLFWASRF